MFLVKIKIHYSMQYCFWWLYIILYPIFSRSIMSIFHAPLQSFLQREVLISILYWCYPNSWLFSVLCFLHHEKWCNEYFLMYTFLSVFLVNSFWYISSSWIPEPKGMNSVKHWVHIIYLKPAPSHEASHVFGEWL